MNGGEEKRCRTKGLPGERSGGHVGSTCARPIVGGVDFERLDRVSVGRAVQAAVAHGVQVAAICPKTSRRYRQPAEAGHRLPALQSSAFPAVCGMAAMLTAGVGRTFRVRAHAGGVKPGRYWRIFQRTEQTPPTRPGRLPQRSPECSPDRGLCVSGACRRSARLN